jgi:ATP-dependent DNA ligase
MIIRLYNDVLAPAAYRDHRLSRLAMDAIIVPKPAILIKCKGVRWVAPALAAEIEFRGWTHDGKLRARLIQGLARRGRYR